MKRWNLLIFAILTALVAFESHANEESSSFVDEPVLIELDTQQAWPLYNQMLAACGNDLKKLRIAYETDGTVLKPFRAQEKKLREDLLFLTLSLNINSRPLLLQLERLSKTPANQEKPLSEISPAPHAYSPLLRQLLIEQSLSFSVRIRAMIQQPNALRKWLSPHIADLEFSVFFSKAVQPYIHCLVRDENCAQIPMSEYYQSQNLPQLLALLRPFVKAALVNSYLRQFTKAPALLGGTWAYIAMHFGVGLGWPGVTQGEHDSSLTREMTQFDEDTYLLFSKELLKREIYQEFASRKNRDLQLIPSSAR